MHAKMIFLLIFLCHSVYAQTPSESVTSESVPTDIKNESASASETSAQVSKSVDGEKEFEFFKNTKTYIKNPFQMRDPFRRTAKKKRVSKTVNFDDQMMKNGVFSNLPSIEGVPVSNIRIVGVLMGKERRAMAKILTGVSSDGKGGQLSNDTYILKEGMKLGIDGAELKAILPGGIVLVEKIRNVYDQDEYLETIVPVSTE